MIEIALEKKPNQEISVSIDDVLYRIKIQQGNPNMLITIIANDELLLSGQPLTPNLPIITRKDKQITGQFYLLSNDEQYPSYKNFGDTCILGYEGK